MDIAIRDNFIALWQKYFPGVELPITFSLGTSDEGITKVQPSKGIGCMICQMDRARKGVPIAFDAKSITCPGGLLSTGFLETMPNYSCFLSKGIPGIFEGIRIKQTNEIGAEIEKAMPKFPAHGKDLIIKRWDILTESDNPEVVIFYVRPEVMTGLFILANYDYPGLDGVICPMASGCSSILLFPWLEQQKENPRAVLGMFDSNARPCVPLDVQTIAFPMKKFEKVVNYMDESFLCTNDWNSVKNKIEQSVALHQKE